MLPTMHSIPALELAKWLRSEQADSSWSVDGDEDLAAILNFPCTGLELATVLEKWEGRELTVLAPSGVSVPKSVKADEFGELAFDEGGMRVFVFASGSDGSADWVLTEENPAGELNAG